MSPGSKLGRAADFCALKEGMCARELAARGYKALLFRPGETMLCDFRLWLPGSVVRLELGPSTPSSRYHVCKMGTTRLAVPFKHPLSLRGVWLTEACS